MTQTTSSAAPSISNQNVVPSEVGWQFVPQYYTFVNKQPNRLHCFYTKNSTFIHGTEGEDGRPCLGQQEIHAKILSLGFNDCKVFIHSVDAQSSHGGGIIIQVIGEMSNNGEPWKKFVQTFFLAEQPNGYFVLNDIFRFLKEESVESEDGSETGGAPVGAHDTVTSASPAPSAPPVIEEEPEQQTHVDSPPVQFVPAPDRAPSPPVDPIPEPAPVVAEYSAPPVEEQPKPHLNGHAVEPEEQQPTDYASVAPSSPAPQEAEPVRASTPPPVARPPSAAAAPPAASVPTPVPAPVPVAATQPQHQPAAPSAPKTWANLAAANSKRWGAAVAQESRGTSESVVPSPPPSGTQTPVTVQTTAASRPPVVRDSSAHHNVSSITTAQVFVKGVVDPITPALLTKTMTDRFGPLKDLDIVPSKACAFFEFLSIDSARRAIQSSYPVAHGGEGGIRIDVGTSVPVRITVETRKDRSERPPPRPRGGPPNQIISDRGGNRGRGAPRGRGAWSGKAV